MLLWGGNVALERQKLLWEKLLWEVNVALGREVALGS